MKTIRWRRLLPITFFAVYIVVVLWVTLYNGNRCFGVSKANLTPFWELGMVIKNEYRKSYLKQIFGNIALFIPFGVLHPLLPKRRHASLFSTVLCGLCFSALIETVQYFSGRGLMEFDDLFNNTLGVLLGYGIYYVISRDFRQSDLPLDKS